jgi:hypothetical protein
MFVQNTPRSRLQIVKIPQCIHHRESRLSVYSPLGSWDSQLYSSPRSRFGCQGVVVLTWRSIQQYVILKINCRLLMFEKLPNLVILIDFLVYSSPGNPLWIQINPWIISKSEIVSGKIHQVGKTPLWWIYWGVLTPELFITRKFCCKPVLMLVHSTPRSWLTGVFITGKLRFPDVFITGELWLPGLFTTGELRLPGVFITG